MALGPTKDSASTRNEYQEYILWGKSDRCIRLPFIADCLQILGFSASWSSRNLSKPVQGVLYQPTCQPAVRPNTFTHVFLIIIITSITHSLYIINSFFSTTETHYVPCDIRTEFVCIYIYIYIYIYTYIYIYIYIYIHTG